MKIIVLGDIHRHVKELILNKTYNE